MSHIDKVIDADPHFVIDPVTRDIKNESSKKTSLVQYDHNSERFSFALPRFVEGHDMLNCNSVKVNYINIDTNTKAVNDGAYTIKDLAICEKNADAEVENVCCTWIISQEATKYAGILQFALCFSCVAEDGKLEYAWNTNPFTSIHVSVGINNAEKIVEQYADVLEQWKIDLFSLSAEGVENINTAKAAALAEVQTAKDNACNVVEQKGKSVLKTIPDDYADLSNKAERVSNKIEMVSNAVKGAESGSQICIDDVSPIEHTLDIKVSGENVDLSELQVIRCGKNLYPPATLNQLIVKNVAPDLGYSDWKENGGNITTRIKGLDCTFKSDGTIIINGTSTANLYIHLPSIPAKKGVTYYCSGCADGGTSETYSLFVFVTQDVGNNGAGVTLYDSTSVAEVISTNGAHNSLKFIINIKSGATFNNAVFKPMVSLVPHNSFEPYNGQIYNPNEDGIIDNVISFPLTSLMVGKYMNFVNGGASKRADYLISVDGVTIDCEYNRDINKVIEELHNAIISLGGNV